MSETVALDIDVNGFVGRRIRRRRKLLGLTQVQLAAACGVTFQQVQKYECAYSRVSVEMLWRLAQAMEVDMGYFFAGLSPGDQPLVLVGDPTGLRLG